MTAKEADNGPENVKTLIMSENGEFYCRVFRPAAGRSGSYFETDSIGSASLLRADVPVSFDELEPGVDYVLRTGSSKVTVRVQEQSE